MNGRSAFSCRGNNHRSTFAGAFLALLLTSLVLALPVYAAPPASGPDFGTVPIGQNTTQLQTLTFSGSGTVSTVAALTQGVAGLDFAASGGTCTVGASSSVGTCTVNVTFKPTLSGVRKGAVVLLDASGNPLATGYVHGIGSGAQVSFPPGTQLPLGGSFNFASPFGLAVDGSGNVFVANGSTGQVEEILAPSYTTVNTLAPQFGTPAGVALDGAGNVFVGDYHNNAVYEILAPNYTTVVTLAPTFNFQNPVGAPVLGFNEPFGIAVDGNGNVFVADQQNHVVEEILAPGYTTVNGYYLDYDVDYNTFTPVWVAVDGSGNIFVGDIQQGAVEEILAASNYSSSNTLVSGFTAETGVAVDGNGNLFITDAATNSVKELLASGGYALPPVVYPLGSSFKTPEGIAVDGNGNVFVSDYTNNIVVKLDYADAPTLAFATPTPVGSIDTTDLPQAVTVQNIGNSPLTFQPFAAGNLLDAVLASSGSTDCSVLSSLQLPAGASCTLGIEFAPSQVGSLTGYVNVVDNALNAASTQAISVQGTGTIGSQTITFANPGTQTYGTPLTLAATASSGLPVTYAVTSGPATVSGSVVTFTGAGSVTVQASQAGDTNYAAASSVSVTFTVNQEAQTITFPNPGTQTYGAAPLTLTATASSALAVTYSVTSGPATVSGNKLTLTGAGSVTVQATQTGNANFLAATPVSATFSVNKVTESYGVTGGSTGVTMKSGSSGTSALSLTSTTFAGTVSFTTSVATTNGTAADVTATATPVTLTAGGTGTSTVTIATTSGAANHAPAVPWKSGTLMFCAVLLGAPFGFRRKRVIAILLVASAISMAGFLMACGSSPSAPRTYTVTVTPKGVGTPAGAVTVTDPVPVVITVTVQ